MDDDVLATTPEIAESDIVEELCLFIVEELCLSQQREVEEKENEDNDKSSIDISFDQSQEKPSRLKAESAFDALKDAALYSDKGDEMQSIIFKFDKL